MKPILQAIHLALWRAAACRRPRSKEVMGAGLHGSSEGGPEARAGGEGGVLSFTRAARLSPWLPELQVPRGSCVELALGDEGGQVRGLSCPHSERHPGRC